MTATNSTGIPHAARCARPVPALRLSWKGTPELWCGGCGRTAALPVPALVDHDEGPLDPRAARPTNP